VFYIGISIAHCSLYLTFETAQSGTGHIYIYIVDSELYAWTVGVCRRLRQNVSLCFRRPCGLLVAKTDHSVLSIFSPTSRLHPSFARRLMVNTRPLRVESSPMKRGQANGFPGGCCRWFSSFVGQLGLAIAGGR